MAEQTSTARTWADILLTGVGAIVDSQRVTDYSVNDPTYNTQGGKAGSAQSTTTTLQAAASNPLVWVGVALAVGLVLIVALKR